MRRSRFVTPVLSIALTLVALPAQAKSSPSALIQAAEKAEKDLRNDERRLRYRHHIMAVVKKWAVARKAADGELAVEAAKGEAKAWALLAHWSGRNDDKRRAKQLAAEAKALAERKKSHWMTAARVDEADGYAVAFDVDGDYDIARNVTPAKNGDVRVYFDLSPVVASKKALGKLGAVGAVKNARIGQFDDDTVRVVFDVPEADAERLVLDGQTIRLRQPEVPEGKRIVKRLKNALEALTDEREKPALLADIVDEVRKSYPEVSVEAEPSTVAKVVAEKIGAKKAVVEKVVAEKASSVRLKRSTRDASKPRPAPLLAVRRIVIDPGHGGKDHGATGPRGLKEKHVNLAIAKALKKKLEKRLSGVKVILTRDKDKFLSLSRRTRIANRSGADLFISVHANANRSKRVHGIETYHLDVTSNRYAKRLAHRENVLAKGAGDVPEPSDAEDELEELIPDSRAGKDLRLILADLAMRSATTESRRLAGYVQSSVVGTLSRDYDKVKDLGVKHALFYVLLGARMPAVLVETGFVSSPMESKRLANRKYQAKLADSVAAGIERFVRERQQLAQKLASL